MCLFPENYVPSEVINKLTLTSQQKWRHEHSPHAGYIIMQHYNVIMYIQNDVMNIFQMLAMS